MNEYEYYEWRVAYAFEEDVYCVLQGIRFWKLNNDYRYKYLDRCYQTILLSALYRGGPEFNTRDQYSDEIIVILRQDNLV